MTDAFLQILLILAYLAIGLLSVTFPIYAISVNYLPQEKWESEKERKKRIENLRKKISELTAELKGEEQDTKRVEELKEQIEKYESELVGTELRSKHLTAKSAVGIPLVTLILALLFVGVGIYCFYEGTEQWVAIFGILSALFSVGAIHELYKTITAVEYAALRLYKTIEFRIGFEEDFKDSNKILVNKETALRLFITTEEIDVENFSLKVVCPVELGLTLHTYSEPCFLVGTSELKKLDVLAYMENFLPRNTKRFVTLFLQPKKLGKYTIEVIVSGKAISESRKQLVVEVVSGRTSTSL